MENDYNQLTENLKHRRFDEKLKKSVLSETFHQTEYEDCVKYALESMVEIDSSYAQNVYAHAVKIQKKISDNIESRGYSVDYRYQGELKTYSNIRLYGDVEVIVIKKNISKKPQVELGMMATDLMDILTGDSNFKSVDNSDKTRITITPLSINCKISVLPSVWINSVEYVKTKNEIYRGIAEFDFKKKKAKNYLPFLDIARINMRDKQTNGAFRCMSRLLKTLCADSPEKIDLQDTEINNIIYSIPVKDIKVEPNKRLSLLPKVDAELEKLHKDTDSFNALLSPSGKNRIFAGLSEKQVEVGKLRVATSKLIEDLKTSLDTKGLTLDSEITYASFIHH